MAPTTTILLLWLGFAATHLTLSALPVRQPLIEMIGENAFRALYSVIALAWFVPLVWVYFRNRHVGPALWNFQLGEAGRWMIYVGMGVAFVLLVSAFVQPSANSITPSDGKPRGVLRITRHPLLMALALFGLLHLIPNGFLSDVIFFGGFSVFVAVGAWHQDQRKLATNPDYRSFFEATPFLPFTGKETLRGLRELSPIAVTVGVALTIVIRYFHSDWFGG